MAPTARLAAAWGPACASRSVRSVVAAVLFAGRQREPTPHRKIAPLSDTLGVRGAWQMCRMVYTLSRNYRSNTESTERHRSKQKLGVGIRIGYRLALLFAIAQSASVLWCSS